MSTTSIRLDGPAEEALVYLAEEFGMTRSEALRRGIVELADRHRREALRAEAEALAADPDDRAEKARITVVMDSLGAEEDGQ